MKSYPVILFLFIIAIATAIGYLSYAVGFLGFIYRVMMPSTFANFPALVLPVIFGIAAFFSPCTLTVLPAYVSHFLTNNTKTGTPNVFKGISLGLVAALGVVVVNLVVGLVIALLGAATPFAKDPRQDIAPILGIRIAAGLLIAYLGLRTILDKPFDIPLLTHLVGRASVHKSMFLYGALYNAAAIGCTGPILLGLMLYAYTTGSFVGALSAFVIFALTMGALMVAFTAAIAVGSRAMMQRILPATPVITKTGGVVMMLTGLTISVLTLEGNRLFVKLFFPFLQQ